MARLVPNETLRTIMTAFLFGTIGSTIALSWVGRESGAHINPAVTAGFWLMRKLDLRAATGYIVAQLLGGWLGALPLLAWGSMGRSVSFGATIPGPGYSTADGYFTGWLARKPQRADWTITSPAAALRTTSAQ
jgi:aquaporin Z